MGLSHEHAESKILEKIQIYILIRAELHFTLCLEIPCTIDAYEPISFTQTFIGA